MSAKGKRDPTRKQRKEVKGRVRQQDGRTIVGRLRLLPAPLAVLALSRRSFVQQVEPLRLQLAQDRYYVLWVVDDSGTTMLRMHPRAGC